MTYRFKGLVGPSNLNSDYATPVSVLADTRPEAVTKMLALGIRGADGSKVWILSVDEEPVSDSVA